MKDYMQNARYLRDVYGYSQALVADKLGISQSQYCKLENGHIKPTINFIDSLCQLYEISLADFLSKSKREILAQVIVSNNYLKSKISKFQLST